MISHKYPQSNTIDLLEIPLEIHFFTENRIFRIATSSEGECNDPQTDLRDCLMTFCFSELLCLCHLAQFNAEFSMPLLRVDFSSAALQHQPTEGLNF